MGNRVLPHIQVVTSKQIAFGQSIGLELRGQSVGVAKARIEDLIDEKFHGVHLGSPTEKQIELARRFGFDISGSSRRVGDATIDDIMFDLNMTAVERESLAPGVKVRNIHDKFGQVEVISSISKDGTVYMRGGNGKRAWARSLQRVDKSER